MTIVTDTTAQIERLYVALDLSKASWVAVLTSLGEEKLRTHRIDARTDHALGELVALIERHRAALARRLATVQHIHFLAAAGAADVPRMALKNSALGSTTITSDLLRKLVR